MNLKKFLKGRFLSLTGQAIMEYFLLFLLITGLCLLSITTLLPRIGDEGSAFFQRAINNILK